MNNKVRIIIGVIVVLFIAIAGYLIGSSGKSSGGENEITEVSQSFIKSITKGDVDGTYNYISEAFQARNGKEYIEGVSNSVKTDSPVITEEEVFIGSGDTRNDAIYLTTVTNLPKKDNSTTGSFIIRLVLESGEWKIDSAQIY